MLKAMLQHDATSNFSRCAAAVLSSEVFEHVVGLTCHRISYVVGLTCHRISYVIGFPMSSDLLCHRSVS
jgi:hypothetical protein